MKSATVATISERLVLKGSAPVEVRGKKIGSEWAVGKEVNKQFRESKQAQTNVSANSELNVGVVGKHSVYRANSCSREAVSFGLRFRVSYDRNGVNRVSCERVQLAKTCKRRLKWAFSIA